MKYPVTARIASFALAALVSAGLLGSINLIAAEQVSAARLAHAQSQADAHVAARTACPARS
jgi:hypothetical protein